MSSSTSNPVQPLPEGSLSILIADDHALVRLGIKTLLKPLPRFRLLGEAVDGNEALAMILAQQPDIVLMDIDMPGLSGIEVATRLREQGNVSRVVMLSASEERETVLAALKAGSRGYLAKNLLLTELEVALDAIARGNSFLSPRVAHYLIESAITAPVAVETPPISSPQSNKAPNGLSLLTERQREVMTAVARGLSTKEIARELGISPKTVEFHRAEICQRLDIHDVAGLVRAAIKWGLL